MATTSVPTTCTAVYNALVTEGSRLTDGMYERAALSRPIIRLQSKTRGEYQLGAGLTQSSVRFERSFAPFTAASGDPAAADPWGTSSSMASADGDAVNPCRPSTDNIQFGQTTFSISPKQYALNTQDFCIRDIQHGFQFAEWMSKVSDALSDIPTWVWARRFTSDYVRMLSLATGPTTGNLLTLNQTSGVVQGATYSTANGGANGRLRQGILDRYYARLLREGAAKPSAIDEATGSAVFTLITSAETSMDIIRSDDALRNDVRYAYMGKGEMTPLVPGVPFKKKNYGGFIHEIDPYPRRFILSGGAYIEQNAWIQSTALPAATAGNGQKWELNPAWEVAPFEESIIWHEGVYKDLVINTTTNIPDGWNFTPRSYMGTFSPRNIIDRTCNPDGTQIFFRGLFASAAKPMNPNVGYSFLHARCAPDATVRSCYVS
jgi:hypothetical protein